MIIFKIVFRPFMRTGRHPGNLALRIIYGLKFKTVSCYMRNLSVIYNCALESWRIVAAGVSPFADVFTGVEETRCRALTASYANTLKNVSIKLFFRLYRSGSAAYNSICNPYFSWCFFFCLYAQGMCFVDLAYLKKSHINDGILHYYRKKSGKQICIFINEGMQCVIDSFACDMGNSDNLFPIIDSSGGNERLLYESAMRTQNRRLKKLVLMAGVSKLLSTHVARHSWATICKNELLSLSVICKRFGHSSEKMTRKYLDSFDFPILGRLAQV